MPDRRTKRAGDRKPPYGTGARVETRIDAPASCAAAEPSLEGLTRKAERQAGSR